MQISQRCDAKQEYIVNGISKRQVKMLKMC